MADTDDSLTGTDSVDVLRGAGGDDTIDGGGSLDLLLGGAGNDSILGGGGDDILRGGSGNDIIEGGEGNDRVRGDSGDDSIDGGEGNDLLLGDAGADTIAGGEGNDTIAGGSGDDSLTGGAGEDTFLFTEGAGNDTITDFDADDDLIDLSLLGEAVAFDDLTITDLADNSGVTITHTALGGTITLLGVSAADLDADNFVLPDGSTTSVTTAENDTLELWESPWDGTENSEIMLDDSPATVINALGGHDWVLAGEGNDTINGGDGYDRLYGEEGDDSIDGGADGDQLYGGSGDDYLSGGAGDDRLYGDSGSDTFVFEAGHGTDTVSDFADGEDMIDLSALTGITAFSDLTITADGTTAVIDLSSQGGGTIRLEDFDVSDLDADDFVFYEAPADEGTMDGM